MFYHFSTHYITLVTLVAYGLLLPLVDWMTGIWRGNATYTLVRVVRRDACTTTISINYAVDTRLYDLFKFSITEIFCDCIDDWLPLAYLCIPMGIYNFMLTTYTSTIRSSVSPVWLVSRPWLSLVSNQKENSLVTNKMTFFECSVWVIFSMLLLNLSLMQMHFTSKCVTWWDSWALTMEILAYFSTWKKRLLLESCTRDIDCTRKSCPLSSLIWRTALYQNPTLTSNIVGGWVWRIYDSQLSYWLWQKICL